MGGLNAWVLIVIAGILETVWALGLKYSDGFTRFWPSVITALAVTASFILLSTAMKSLPVGTAYAVWVGIGVLGTVVFGVILLGELVTLQRIAGIGLLLAGIIVLKLA
jgi:quaternary ammonium compound-resistance protein SugE